MRAKNMIRSVEQVFRLISSSIGGNYNDSTNLFNIRALVGPVLAIILIVKKVFTQPTVSNLHALIGELSEVVISAETVKAMVMGLKA